MRLSISPVVGLVLSSCVFASDSNSDTTYDQRRHIDIMATYMKLDDDRNIEDSDFGGSVIFGVPFSEHWSWENQIGMYGLDTGTSNSSDYYQININTGVRYNFDEHWGFTPFLLAGLGLTRNDVIPNSDDSINPMFNLGFGALSPTIFDLEMRLRMEARYIYDDFDGAGGDLDIPSSKGNGAFKDWHVSIGIVIPLGSTDPIYSETIIEKETFIETNVFIDSDGDTIPDSADMCPDTIKGADVDARGCLLKNQVVVLRNITFELASDQIEPSSYAVLDDLVATLQSQKDFNLEVIGHTDNVGAESFNQQLSEKRAVSVARYLIDKGIANERITASGKGESQPIASNAHVSGRAMNRRVEFYISER